MGMITRIRASMPESRETAFRPASGGGIRMVIDASKLDSFVQLADHQAKLEPQRRGLMRPRRRA